MQIKAPSFVELVRVFARIGCLSFGGPAGQIALMHKELVEDRRWVSEDEYLHALNFCHLLPGPEAQQLATWIGWRLHGVKGGLVAGSLFVLPGALIVLLLSILYGYAAQLNWFSALLLGVKAAVLAIVLQALIRIAQRALDTPFKWAVAVSAFVALFVLNAPFPLVVLGAGLVGIIVSRQRPDWLNLKASTRTSPITARPWAASIKAVMGWGAVWAAPMLVIMLTLGRDHPLWEIGSFFSKLAVVTFGGAYAVLAYMAQESVQSYGWLSAGEMADGLGLAETTPGPLILVTQFVGYLAAFRSPEPFSPVIAGIIGAGLTSWVTFAPCFLWIFAFAPWLERLERLNWLKGGLATLTAAIVGVIANLSLWFTLHILFKTVSGFSLGPFHVSAPDWTSFDWRAGLLASLAAFLLIRLKWNVVAVLAASAVSGLALGQI